MENQRFKAGVNREVIVTSEARELVSGAGLTSKSAQDSYYSAVARLIAEAERPSTARWQPAADYPSADTPDSRSADESDTQR